ncbi:hypothetical protein C0995_006472, partial [Termitomyces sp. Mi166
MTISYGMHRVDKPPQEGIPYHHDVPVHLLMQLSTAPTSVYQYLKERQQTAHAQRTGLLFKQPELQMRKQVTKTINFEKFALQWNEMVHIRPDSKIFYKIPQQLERHHKVWAAYRAEKANLSNSAQARKSITDILNDSNRKSRVLPALTLPIQSHHAEPLRGDKGKEHAKTDN